MQKRFTFKLFYYEGTQMGVSRDKYTSINNIFFTKSKYTFAQLLTKMSKVNIQKLFE